MNLNIVIKILFEKNKNVYLSGIGGCGKSYLAKQLKQYCKENDINCVLTSTTGVSAYNIGGQTIHSWSGIVFNKIDEDTLERIIKRVSKKKKDVRKIMNVQLLIIDEISMLGGLYLEVLDHVFKKVRGNNNVFGGIRVLFTGDFLQLPPVNDVYAFQSVVWNELNLVTLELTEPKRFNNPEYASMLMRIRRQECEDKDIECLRKRCEAYNNLDKSSIEKYTILMSKKTSVNDYNKKKLDEISGIADIIISKDKVIETDDISKVSLENIDEYEEMESDHTDFEKYFMAPNQLVIKKGCKVMIVHNLDQESGIVNGARGTFIDFECPFPQYNSEIKLMVIKMDDGNIVKINKVLFSQQQGDQLFFTRVQYPVILSYAMTIHKCQGLTLSNVIVDLGKDIFTAGQAYVSLSRCKELDSLYLSSFSKNKLYCDDVAKKFEDSIKKYKLK
jgi:ATP-dependent DNA helicase PIF1